MKCVFCRSERASECPTEQHRAVTCINPMIYIYFLTTTAKKSTIQVLQIIHNGLFLHCIHYSHKGFGRRYLYHTLTFLQRSWAFERSSTWRNEIVPQK